jgi:hypothetical protein
MKNASRSRLIYAAALAALPLGWLACSAQGQYRIDTGHDNDANNRIGSGGYNNNHDWTQPSMGASNDQILTGNVTGLRYFHGNAQTFDPNVLQTNTETTASDVLNAQAGPVNYGQRSTGQQTAQPFYSTAIVNNAPPPGTVVTTPNNVGYLPAGPQVQQANDQRLGVINAVPNAALNPTPGELDLPGPVDTSGNPMMTTMSPLYGARDWSAGDPNDMYFLSRYSNLSSGLAATPGLDSGSIQKMRNELSATVVQGSSLAQQDQANGPGSGATNNLTAQNNAQGNANGQDASANGAPGSTNLAQGQQLNRPVGTGSVSLNQQSMGTNLDRASLSSSLNTSQGQQQRMLNQQLPPPGQQSSQLAMLEDRERSLESESKQPMNDEQASRLYNQERSTRAKIGQETASATGVNSANGIGADSKGMGSGMGAGVTSPGGYGAIGGPAPSSPMPSVAAPPAGKSLNPMLTAPQAAPSGGAGASQSFVITSLATGIRSPGLADMLRSAETQMRQGKFNNALDTYDSAQQVAPNNPFIRLGRGFAELGASYYGRAEGDTRRAIAAEPALLAGRYDLKGFLGEDRLNFVTRDLQDIFKSEKTSEQSAFLLAFLSHNAGQDDQAAMYLDAAEQRGGHADPVVQQMRRDWGLPLGK